MIWCPRKSPNWSYRTGNYYMPMYTSSNSLWHRTYMNRRCGSNSQFSPATATASCLARFGFSTGKGGLIMTQGNNYGVLSARFTSITNAAELTLYGAITKKFKLSTLPILNFVKQIVELALTRLSRIQRLWWYRHELPCSLKGKDKTSSREIPIIISRTEMLCWARLGVQMLVLPWTVTARTAHCILPSTFHSISL